MYHNILTKVFSETLQEGEGAFVITEVYAISRTERHQVPVWLEGLYIYVAAFDGDPDVFRDPLITHKYKMSVYEKSKAIRYAIKKGDVLLAKMVELANGSAPEEEEE